MTVDAGVAVAVVGNEFLQFHGCLGQVVDVEGHILNEAGRAHGTRAAHPREDAGADGPILAVDFRVLGEHAGAVEMEGVERLGDAVYLAEQFLVGRGLGLGEDGRQVVIVAGLHALNLTGIHVLAILQVDGIVNGRERLVVQHLGTLHHQVLAAHLHVLLSGLQLLHLHHSFAALAHRVEVVHG